MRLFGAILIVAALVLSMPGHAMARPPAGPGQSGKQNLFKPPPEGAVRLIGLIVKSEVPDTGGTRQLTIVLTHIGSVRMPVDREALLLEPFGISCPEKGTDFALGHRVEALCRLVLPEPGMPRPEGNLAGAGIVGTEFANSLQASDKPDFDLMDMILKEAVTNDSRSLVVDVLKGIPGKRSSRTLTTAVFDITVAIRLKAARELIARDYKPALEKLTAMLLMDIESELTFQLDLAEELAAAGHEEGTKFLLRHIGDARPEIATAAIRALARTGGADEASQLKALAESSEDEEIVTAAREAAQEIEQRLSEE